MKYNIETRMQDGSWVELTSESSRELTREEACDHIIEVRANAAKYGANQGLKFRLKAANIFTEEA